MTGRIRWGKINVREMQRRVEGVFGLRSIVLNGGG